MHGVRHVGADHEGARGSLLEGCDVGGGGGQAGQDELSQVGLGSLSALWPHLQATQQNYRRCCDFLYIIVNKLVFIIQQ